MPTDSQSATTPPIPTALSFTSNFPVPAPMKVSGDRINNWEDYELVTGLDKRPETIRLATLRSIMGKDCLQIFLNLKLTEEESTSVNASLAALEAYFKPKTSVVYERYLFNSSTQGPDEGIDEFVNRLRKQTSSYKFGTLTDEMIRDRIVIGLQDRNTKLRLLKEEDLDLNKTVNICRASEIATRQLQSMKLDQTGKQVNAMGTQAKRFNNKQLRKSNPLRNPPGKRKPTRCGSPEKHKLEDCRAYGQTCLVCKKPNHFATVCRFNDKSKSRNPKHRDVRQVETSDEESEENDDLLIKVEEVSNMKTNGKQINTTLVFSDMKEDYHTELQCQLDTGAMCSVMSLRDLAVITQTGDPPLKSSKVKLRLFDGSLMKPHGVAILKIHRNGSTTQLNFQIVDTKNKPLLSPETCEKLGSLKVTINETSAVNTVVTEQDKLQVLLTREAIQKEYKDVFEGLGHIGISSSFVVNPDHTTVQHAPRRVAVTLQKEVKEKIAEMEKKGIIQKVTEPTEWISSMVVVAKPGKIRICLDPRDLNKAIQRPKYHSNIRCQLWRKYCLNSAKLNFLQPSMLKMLSIRSDWMKLVARKQLSGHHLADTDISECHLVSALLPKNSNTDFMNSYRAWTEWRF